jgi:hypothetical protein
MIPTWLIVALGLFAVMFFLFKTMNQVYLLSLIRNNFFYFVMIGVFIFLAISLTHIHVNYDIDLTSKEGIIEAGGVYLNWITKVFSNLGKVTGYVFQQDWLADVNKTG